MSDIPAPGCLTCRCFINWNTGGVNDGGFVHLVAESAIWVQHTLITVTKMKRITLMLAETTGAPPHFPLYSAVSVGPSDWFWRSDTWWGRWELEGLSHLPTPPAAPSEPTLRWDRLVSETLDVEEPVNLQQILVNHAFLSHWDLLPKYGLAHPDPGQLVPNYTKAFISLVSIM